MSRNLDTTVNHRLVTVASLQRRLVYRIIAESGVNITPEQWTILHYLWKEDGRTIGELVKYSKKDFANVTRIVDKLVKQGYVKKERDSEDSRKYRIFLLPKADNICEDIRLCQDKVFDISLKGISEVEQDFLLELFDKIEKNILVEFELKGVDGKDISQEEC